MVEMAPLRGLHYNLTKVPDLKQVVTPPYDVISPTQQSLFYEQHPYNMVRLILPRQQPGDSTEENRYIRAARDFTSWQQNGILSRDPQPAFYYWETTFEYQGRRLTRGGVVGLVRLEPFESGMVRPHEKTFSATKNDRFQLMQHCRAHFSPIFALYSDATDRVLTTLRAGLPATPLFDFEDLDGFRQRFYRVTEPQLLRDTAKLMADLTLYIADGHHRYETALAYQAWLRPQFPQASPRASFNYVLMYLSNLLDDNLVILPAHRLVDTLRLTRFEESELLARLPEYFDLQPFTAAIGEPSSDGPKFTAALAEAEQTGAVLGLAAPGSRLWLLRLKPGIMNGPLAAQVPPALAKLDVMALNYLIFEKIMGLSRQEQDDEETFKYASTAAEALGAVACGRAGLAFLLNPTRIEQVQEVAAAGLIMPRKSTYFYPKILAGLVMHPINPQEEVGL
ncbi:MAG: DUF1015 domain-containing protein [Deltaproteobacteria bacterium]|nr:DUF1015 domain-containing protein [Deltaproteobacteria bacterium]